jgi:hypothetical protein
MQEIPPKVNEVEMEFLVKLDAELEKVESFYLDREKEAKEMYEAPVSYKCCGFTSDMSHQAQRTRATTSRTQGP